MMLKSEHGRRRDDDQIIVNGGRQDELDELTKASHEVSLRQQVKEKTTEGDEDDQWTRLTGR